MAKTFTTQPSCSMLLRSYLNKLEDAKQMSTFFPLNIKPFKRFWNISKLISALDCFSVLPCSAKVWNSQSDHLATKSYLPATLMTPANPSFFFPSMPDAFTQEANEAANQFRAVESIKAIRYEITSERRLFLTGNLLIWAPAEPPSRVQPWAVKSLIVGEQMVARQKQFCGGI